MMTGKDIKNKKSDHIKMRKKKIIAKLISASE